MRILLQRVRHASVTVEGEEISRIGQGLLLLVGVGPQDSRKEADFLAENASICEFLKMKTAK